jgi:hypothetical protein
VLLGLDTVSIGEPSARLADPSSGPATTAQEWGVSVIESGEFQVIATKAERGDAEGDRDDEDAHDHSSDRVRQSKPKARQDEPDQVENRAHGVSLTLSEPTRLGVPASWSAANAGGVGLSERGFASEGDVEDLRLH